jgi:hypothetical protein
VPAKTVRRAGPPRPAGPTPANTRTGNHPTGRTSSCPRTLIRTSAGTTTWNHPIGPTEGFARTPAGTTNRHCHRTRSRSGPNSRLRIY